MKNGIDYSRIADLYDTYVQTTLDVEFFLKEAKETSGEVLELMAGTGRLSIPLIEADVRLTCVDNSPEMLAILERKLKKRTLSACVYEMDVRKLFLNKEFGLIIIPFHSFSEILDPSDQREVLSAIYQHLAKAGRFICTLHNPRVRLKSVDGQKRLRGKYFLGKIKGTLLVWSAEYYNANSHIVNGVQLYEEYDVHGVMLSKRVLEIQFYVHQKDEFEELATSAGFKVVALYGDYSYSVFEKNTSPFMIWALKK